MRKRRVQAGKGKCDRQGIDDTTQTHPTHTLTYFLHIIASQLNNRKTCVDDQYNLQGNSTTTHDFGASTKSVRRKKAVPFPVAPPHLR